MCIRDRITTRVRYFETQENAGIRVGDIASFHLTLGSDTGPGRGGLCWHPLTDLCPDVGWTGYRWLWSASDGRSARGRSLAAIRGAAHTVHPSDVRMLDIAVADCRLPATAAASPARRAGCVHPPGSRGVCYKNNRKSLPAAGGRRGRSCSTNPVTQGLALRGGSPIIPTIPKGERQQGSGAVSVIGASLKQTLPLPSVFRPAMRSLPWQRWAFSICRARFAAHFQTIDS